MDPAFERVARRLTTLQLRAPSDDDDGFALLPGTAAGRTEETFVGTYTVAGLRTVLDEYGLQDKLAARGLGDVTIEIHVDDPYRHRFALKLPDGRAVMDLRLHLCTIAAPQLDVVVVEWLLMQNPRAQFTPERPALPGQTHPGTGLGREVAQLLVLLCRRIGRAALVMVPEHFHLAELYRQVGYVAARADDDNEIDAVLHATRALSLTERAWCVERGFVRDATNARYAYQPHDCVLVVDDRAVFTPAPPTRAARAFHVDDAWVRAKDEPWRS